MKRCCFTGHRQLAHYSELEKNVHSTLTRLISEGYSDFYAGGALGWDTLCAETVLALRDNEHKQIALHLILPCPAKEQTLKWSSAQIQQFQNILRRADSVEVMSPYYHRDCMRIRNQRMVDMADLCLCYYDPKRYASGTGQTVRMSQRKGIPLINLAEI